VGRFHIVRNSEAAEVMMISGMQKMRIGRYDCATGMVWGMDQAHVVSGEIAQKSI